MAIKIVFSLKWYHVGLSVYEYENILKIQGVCEIAVQPARG